MARGKWLSDGEKQRIKRMCAEGMSPAEIAAEMQRGVKSIKRVLGSPVHATQDLTKEVKAETLAGAQRLTCESAICEGAFQLDEILGQPVQPCEQPLANQAPIKVNTEKKGQTTNRARTASAKKAQEPFKIATEQHVGLMDATESAQDVLLQPVALSQQFSTRESDSSEASRKLPVIMIKVKDRAPKTTSQINCCDNMRRSEKHESGAASASPNQTLLPTSTFSSSFGNALHLSEQQLAGGTLMPSELPQKPIGYMREEPARVSSYPIRFTSESLYGDLLHTDRQNNRLSDLVSMVDIVSDDDTQGSKSSCDDLSPQSTTLWMAPQRSSITLAQFLPATQTPSFRTAQLVPGAPKPKKRKVCSDVLEKAMSEMEHAIHMAADYQSSEFSGARLRLIFQRFQADVRLAQLDRAEMEDQASQSHKSRPTDQAHANESSFRV